MKKNRFTLAGYYGFNNAGDDLLLIKSIQLLNSQYNNPAISVLYSKKTPPALGGKVQTVNRRSPLKIFMTIRNSQKLIFGGGSLLQNKTSRTSLIYYLSLIWIAKLTKTEVVLLAQGIGPLNGRLSKWLTKKTLKIPSHISLRDPQSKKTLEDLQISKSKLTLLADLAFYDSPKPLTTQKIKNPVIGVSLRQNTLTRSGLKSISESLSSLQTPLLFLNLQPPQDPECLSKTIKTSELFQNYLELNAASIQENPKRHGIKLILSMRYHTCVWAATHHIPFIALASDPKLSSLAIDCNQPHIDISSPFSREKLDQAIEDLLRNYSSYKTKVQVASETLSTRWSALRRHVEPKRWPQPIFSESNSETPLGKRRLHILTA